jgi:two-component system cell cycle sensor histidine kinase PleC
MQADVVAGYTFVPRTGWGVMIPQPFPELVERASDVGALALVIIGVGMLITAAISWWLARALAMPIRAVADSAGQLARGEGFQRLKTPHPLAPRELDDLVVSFNVMSDEMNAKSEELMVEAARAEIASRSKSEFLAHMSHELRTPLNAIIGFAEVMNDATFGPIGNDRYEIYVDDILKSAQHLRGMIDDVLDLTKAEAGLLGMESQSIVIDDLADACLTQMRERARARDIRLIADLPADAPLIYGDLRACRQVLLNLLSNAVKFTPAGGTVTVGAGPDDAGGYRITVTDTGVGIAPEDMQTITDPFSQIGDPMRQSGKGAGLGLHLAKRFMELHDGWLEIDSEPGKGTRASAVFPAERVHY